ncbi:hypothetical protein D1867_07370 [Acidianus infernus]|uniref:ABC transporter substrate-binding protein n=1 Tax=Acidianus infernus TaxID=12915 RepID=A0A6A9QE45_ACIIN|nr:hypothetical protein [Acidianus infernus]MUM65059.1 hypothetical protein [Acidianus infernus]
MLDLTDSDNNITSLLGYVDSKVVIFMDSALSELANTIFLELKENYIKSLIEILPSGIIMKQIFNEDVKFGNLIYDKPPRILILPSSEISSLKQWELLLAVANFVKIKMFIATELDDICKAKRIAIVNPEYSVFSINFIKSYKCHGELVLVKNDGEVIKELKKGNVDAGVTWFHSAKANGLKGYELNKTFTIQIGLFKGADKTLINAFEILRNSHAIREYAEKIGMVWLG